MVKFGKKYQKNLLVVKRIIGYQTKEDLKIIEEKLLKLKIIINILLYHLEMEKI